MYTPQIGPNSPQPLLSIEKKVSGSILGRTVKVISYLPMVLLELVLKIINLFFSLFNIRIICFSSHEEIVEQKAIEVKPKVIEEQKPKVQEKKIVKKPVGVPDIKTPSKHKKNAFPNPLVPLSARGERKAAPFVEKQDVVMTSSEPDVIMDESTLQTVSTSIQETEPDWMELETVVLPAERETLHYLAGNKIKEESDHGKIKETLSWVLAQEEKGDEHKRTLREDFVAGLVKRYEALETECEGSYLNMIESLAPYQKRTFGQLLTMKGKPAPLFFHLKREHQAAKLCDKSTYEVIGERLKIIFSSFTPMQAESFSQCDDFWCLVYLYKEISAVHLSADVLGVLARNEQKHAAEFKMLLPCIPENDDFFGKLNAIASQASDKLEQVLMSKVDRLVRFQYAINGRLATKEQKLAAKNEVIRNYNESIKRRRAERLEYLEKIKRRLETEPPTPSAAPRKKWEVGGPKKDAQVPIVEPKPLPQWPAAQCLSFLEAKSYSKNDDQESEDIVFDWILKQEKVLVDDAMKSQATEFIEFTLSKPLYIETTRARLEQMDEPQLRTFIQLLGEKKIDTLWTLEAKFDVALSAEENKIQRLKIAFGALSEKQFSESIKSEKFYELLRTYPQYLGAYLSVAQWTSLAQSDRKEDLVTALNALILKMDTSSDREFVDKLLAVAPLIKKWPVLKQEIERKMMICPAEQRKKIQPFLK